MSVRKSVKKYVFWHVLTRNIGPRTIFWHVLTRFDTFLTLFWHFFDTFWHVLTRFDTRLLFDTFWYVLTLSKSIVFSYISIIFWHFLTRFHTFWPCWSRFVRSWRPFRGVREPFEGIRSVKNLIFWYVLTRFDTKHHAKTMVLFFDTRARANIFWHADFFDTFWHELEHLRSQSAGVKK